MNRPSNRFAPAIAELCAVPKNAASGSQDLTGPACDDAPPLPMHGFAITEAPEGSDETDRANKYPIWIRLAVILLTALGAWALTYAVASTF